MWFSRGYLSSALRNLKAGAFEEPHHLHLQRLLRRRPRAARGRPWRAVLRARHGGTGGLLGAQTLRVAGATARPRPRPQLGRRTRGGRRRRPGPLSTLCLLLVSRARGGRGRAGGRGRSFCEKERGAPPAPRVPRPGWQPSRTLSGISPTGTSRAALASRQRLFRSRSPFRVGG